ncbi:MAG: inositol monophosphatase [Coxiella sp. (in: Bacteria)]|nr:MAG: inositol monophosphatase [Coxiella sp. (in: g-proteobacteria)]
MNPFLNIAIQAARASGRVIMRFADQLDRIEVTEKGRNDLVTQVDQLAEQEIIEHITKAYPRHSIISEEAGHLPKDEDMCWVIDPLDGTANFVHGFPQFAISIALKKKGQLEMGCIYDPVRQELFTAVKGKGAHLNNRRIRIGTTRKMQNALVGTGFPFRQPEQKEMYLKTFANVFTDVSDIRRAGAAALDLAYVACGRLDAFWEFGLKEWDMAAAVLMIKEAGGFVSDCAGNTDYLTSGNIVAGNVYTHPALLDCIQK